jgi:hypothetical protein
LPRGEDEGEGFNRMCANSILTLPLSFEKGEAPQYACPGSPISTCP